MQLYHRILIGMVVGTAAGLFLGPQSSLLTRDLVIASVGPGGGPSLQLDPSDPSTAVVWPAFEPSAKPIELRLSVSETRTEVATDSQGAKIEVAAWSRVAFDLPEPVLRRDEGKLREQLGDPPANSEVQAWLRIQRKPLAAGGFALSPEPVSKIGVLIGDVSRPVGNLFLRLIKMVIVPLVFASLLVGVASLGDVRKLGRLGGRTLLIFFVTTGIAVALGLVAAQIFSPGRYLAEADRLTLLDKFAGDASKRAASADNTSVLDALVAIVPDNPVGALVTGDMLQVIFFACLLGVALTALGQKQSQLVVDFFDRVQEAMIWIVNAVMLLAPVGVAALMFQVVGASGASILGALAVYAAAVVVGLIAHTVLVYGFIVRFFGRFSFRQFFRAIRPAQLIAFSTSSSSATLPVTLECAEEKLGISNGVASFVLPLGSTVNMDGTALYQGVAAVFIAQVFQLDLTLADQASIVLTATLASVGAAGVPGAGMVTLTMVLTTAGIPVEGLALILGVDRILDMCRTTVNVTGDLAVATAVAKMEGEELRSR
jgi:Na+/H+-dicarboxylate symporter